MYSEGACGSPAGGGTSAGDCAAAGSWLSGAGTVSAAAAPAAVGVGAGRCTRFGRSGGVAGGGAWTTGAGVSAAQPTRPTHTNASNAPRSETTPTVITPYPKSNVRARLMTSLPARRAPVDPMC